MTQGTSPETVDMVCRNLIATYMAVADVIQNPPKDGIKVTERVILQDLLANIQGIRQNANGYSGKLEAIEKEVKYALESGKNTRYDIVSLGPVTTLPQQEVVTAVEAAVIKIDRMDNLPIDRTFADETEMYRPKFEKAEAKKAIAAAAASVDTPIAGIELK